jgi:hypothetical protein
MCNRLENRDRSRISGTLALPGVPSQQRKDGVAVLGRDFAEPPHDLDIADRGEPHNTNDAIFGRPARSRFVNGDIVTAGARG